MQQYSRTRGWAFIAIGIALMLSAVALTTSNCIEANQAEISTKKAVKKLIEIVEEEQEKNKQIQETATGEDEPLVPDYEINPQMDMPSVDVDGSEYIGILKIPTLDLELPVLNEWSYDNLKRSPCRYTGSVYAGDLVICAHNYDIHFGYIKYLSAGDKIELVDIDGNSFQYTVAEMETLEATDIDLMTAGDWDLTLFTCTVGGRARVTVRCVMSTL